MKKLFLAAVAILSLVAVSSCKKDESDAKLKLSSSSIEFSAAGGYEEVAVISSSSWDVSTDASWLTARVSDEDSRLLIVEASANIAPSGSCADKRSGTVTVTSAGKSATIEVSQTEEAVVFVVAGDTDPAQFTWEGGQISIKISSNLQYTITKPDWIAESDLATKATAVSSIVYDVLVNEETESRKGDIVITPADGESPMTITVKQAGKPLPDKKDITVSFEGSAYALKEGDVILLTDGATTEEYTVSAESITEEGTKISTMFQNTVYAVFPASAYESASAGQVNFKVPAAQSSASPVYLGSTLTESMVFKPATASITFDARSLSMTSVEIESAGICGSASATFSGENFSVTSGNAGKITYTIPAEGPYAISVLPCTIASGSAIKYVGASGTVGSASFSGAKSLTAGQTLGLGAAVIEKAVPGVFSVSATRKVAFANGNLNYKASTSTWSFAEHQYVSFKTGEGNAVLDGRESQDKLIDLFGWGTTGENENGAKPYDWNSTNANYKTAATASADEVLSISNKADWGYCFGGSASPWFTLTRTEFAYVFQDRAASTLNGVDNARFAAACVDLTYNGFILFPDNFSLPQGVTIEAESINNLTVAKQTEETGDMYTANHMTADQWNLLEAAGCVFLPSCCNRTVSSSKPKVSNTLYGFYWCAEAYDAAKAQSIAWDLKALTGGTGRNRSQGCAVRLVTEVK